MNLIKLDKLVFLVAFIITLTNIFGSDFSDDINHYHYPYILNTDNTNYIWGLSFLHTLYGTSPLWLIGQSYFNFDYSRLQDIHILNGLVLFLFLGIFLTELKENKIKINIYKPIILSLLIFVLIKYTRIKEFGIDRPAYLFFFISILYYYKYLYFSKNKDQSHYFLIYCLILISIFFIKVIFLFVLIFPLFLIDRKNIYSNFFHQYNILIPFFIISYFIKNILISGCIIFPLSISCIDYIPWSNTIGAMDLSNSSEILNKSFNQYSGTLLSSEYIKNFVWLETWFLRHKVEITELVLTIFVICLLTFLSFKKKGSFKNISIYSLNHQKALYIFLFCSLLLFIFKNPNIRMSHHIFVTAMILSVIIFFQTSLILVKKNFLISLVIISLCFNFSKNFKRIDDLGYKNNIMINISNKIYKPKKYTINEFEYYAGWHGNAPIGNRKLEDINFKKVNIFKILYN